MISNAPGILFDLDGTLLNTATDIQYVINEIRKEQGLSPLSVEQVRPHVSGGSGLLLNLLRDVPPAEAERKALQTALLNRYQQHDCQYIIFFPGMEELLHDLHERKISWGIVTNRTRALAEKVLACHPILNKAHCIVCADTTPHPKPHPAPLRHACEILNIAPASTVYIGDDSIDIFAGRAAGIKTLLMLFGYADPVEAAEWGADHTFSDAEALSAWLSQYHVKQFYA
jgi:2-phosphoglycolate phosphatase